MIGPGQALQSVPEEDRPRERLLRGGGSSLSDAELLAVLLRTGRPGASAVDLAREILAERRNLAGLLGTDLRTLRRRGFGPAKASAVLAAVELARRLAHHELPKEDILGHPGALARYLRMRYGGDNQEVMGALYLDALYRRLSDSISFRGTSTYAAVEPRAIFREALRLGAASVVLFHTHPSGDPTPSQEDIDFTRRMKAAGDLIGVRVADHIVIGSVGRWQSLRRSTAW